MNGIFYCHDIRKSKPHVCSTILFSKHLRGFFLFTFIRLYFYFCTKYVDRNHHLIGLCGPINKQHRQKSVGPPNCWDPYTLVVNAVLYPQYLLKYTKAIKIRRTIFDIYRAIQQKNDGVRLTNMILLYFSEMRGFQRFSCLNLKGYGSFISFT